MFAGSRGASSNPTTAGSAAGGSGAANQLKLRNISANRTLVLMDGKRVPPTLYNSAVDVGLIPQMFVERVDIVTGGVSAVYGSDAMSGVVNYVIAHKFNGFKSDLSYGKSTYGDAGTAANPDVLQTNVRQKQFPFGGLITSGAPGRRRRRLLGFRPAGTAQGHAAVRTPRLRPGAGHTPYAQLSGNLKTNTNFAETDQLNNVTLRSTNAFLPAQYQALVPSTQKTFTYSQFPSEIPRLQADSDSKQWVFVTGLEGKLGGAKWNVDYTYGRSRLDTSMANVINRQNLSAALDAVTSGGKTVCNVTVANPGLADNCVPFNAFGPTAASSAAIDDVTDTIRFDSTTAMHDLTAALTGSPLDSWAGPVNAALSGEWRDLTFSSHSSARPTDLVNCTGLTLNCTAGNTLTEYVFGESPQGVGQRVLETAGEVDVPLLRDAPLAKKLDLNTAARYTKYDRSGNYWTWKAGLEWSITDQLRVRGARSRDIRAPTLYDLYAPRSQVVVRPTDLLTGASPAVPQIDESNPDLKAEIGNTTTLGVVWKPLPKLSFALDGYRLKISDAITTVSGSTAAFQRACYQSGGASPFCALQLRPNGYTDTSAANAVTTWINQSVNISNVETYGLDFETNYATRLFDRPASLRFLTAWQPHVIYRQPGLTTIDQGDAAFGSGGMAATPSVRLSAYLRFRPMDDLTVDINERWNNPMKISGDPTEVWLNNRIASFGTTGINLAYKLGWGNGDVQLYFNVDNLFNKMPPVGAFEGNGTRAGLRDGFALGDDPRGRYYTVGIRSLF